MLLDAGAEIETRADFGKTPLLSAMRVILFDLSVKKYQN